MVECCQFRKFGCSDFKNVFFEFQKKFEQKRRACREQMLKVARGFALQKRRSENLLKEAKLELEELNSKNSGMK